MRNTFFLLIFILHAGNSFAAAPAPAAPAPAAQAEVAHLLDYLTQSGCQFQRNGSWHAAPEARAHLQRKYDYLAKRGLVKQAEDFIRHGASQSSLSGKPYQVKCGDNTPRASGPWLHQELQRHRQTQKDKS